MYVERNYNGREDFTREDTGLYPARDAKLAPHALVKGAVDLSRQFLEKPEGRRYLRQENHAIADGLSTIEGFIGACGVGFPYNVPEGKIPEITHFLGKTDQLIQADIEKNPHGWGCPDCQIRNKLPDLKSQCKPCTSSALKPRDVFIALPDIDVFVVADTVSPTTESHIEAAVGKLGYTQSDVNILESVKETSSALQAINSGQTPEAKLPIDIHVLSGQDFINGMERMTAGDLEAKMPMRSLHTTWEVDTVPFGFDFLFSLTPLRFNDKGIIQRIHNTRSTLRDRYGDQALVDFVENASPRARRLLQDDAVKANLQERIASW